MASWRDLRNAAFAGADGLRAQFGEEFAAVRFAASLESRRHTSSPFDEFDGALSDPERVSAIARRFGPDHSFSVNQIETYLACPFRFFMERILEVEDAEPPVSEFDDLVRGLILHAVLERFHRHFATKPVTELSEPEAEGTIRAIVYEMFDACAWRSVTAPPGVVEIEKRRMHEQMLRYLRICRERDGEAAWAPSHFEVAFGRTETPSMDPLTQVEPFSLDTGAGAVLFSGRVDRVDLRAGAARIIDYKTSYAPRPKDIQDGLSIQLTLYALALENFLAPGTDCAEAYYVPVGKKRWVEGLGKAANAWEGRAGLARRQVGESVAGIRAGRFAPMPQGDECARCSARRPCRYESGRIERKAQEAYGPNS
ncbi:MAG: PD-(D/E)XK nuclease family protein [Candidatus Hydrogenedentes bacterium]|nr:PD-(D/E)XK nuclease family protein [Candidatus Hydrogenedentota bacterium]